MNQFIPTDKYDSKRSYKHADGYYPGTASIGNYPVYIENRNGNSNVKYQQEQALQRAYDLLGEFGIRPKYSRMDCGSFDREKTYRYVVSREKNDDGQSNVFSGDHYIYRAIMTNNREMTDLEVIEFYNDRGEIERLFDGMDNDFNWKKMPFSFLHENTVFLVKF